MTIFIGADHGGFELKNKLIEYLQTKGITVEDMGNTEYDPLDDYPDFGKKVAQAVLQHPGSMGILSCRTADGIAITANRFKGIRCSNGFNVQQVTKSRQDDDINILAISGDFTDLDTAKQMVDAFLSATPKTEEKYIRRRNKIDE